MIAFPGMYKGTHLQLRANSCSDFHLGIRDSGLRHRNGIESLQIRTVCSAREMERNNMCRGHSISASSDLDADHYLANV